MTSPTKRDPQAILGSLLDAARTRRRRCRRRPVCRRRLLQRLLPAGQAGRCRAGGELRSGPARLCRPARSPSSPPPIFRADALAALPERAVAMARLAPEDKFAGLAPKDRLAKTIPAAGPGRRRRTQRRTSDRTRPRRRKARRWRCRASPIPKAAAPPSRAAPWRWPPRTGFYGRYAGTSHGIGVAVLAGEGTGMERDYDHASARHAADLRSAAEIGRTAGEKAVKRLNPRSMKSQSVPVVFHPDEAGGPAGPFRRRHFRRRHRPRRLLPQGPDGPAAIFAPGINIIDDPHRRARPALQAVRRRRRRQCRAAP